MGLNGFEAGRVELIIVNFLIILKLIKEIDTQSWVITSCSVELKESKKNQKIEVNELEFWLLPLTSLSLLSRARRRNPSQSSKHYSQYPPDIVRYFKSTRLQLEGVSVCYEENQGDAILVIEGPSSAIAAAKNDLDRQATSLCRQQYMVRCDTLENFRTVSHSDVIQSLRGAKAWAGWHADAAQGMLYICGKDRSVVDRAFSAISQLFDTPVQASPSFATSQRQMPLSPRSPGAMGAMPVSPRFSTTQQPLFPTSPTPQLAMTPETFSDKMDMNLEVLRYLKTTKICKELLAIYQVNITLNQSPIEVSGQRRQVFSAIEHIHSLQESLAVQGHAMPSVFLSCLSKVQNKEVIASLRSGNVRAGWDIRDGKLWVCSDNCDNGNKATKVITGLISHGEFPENGGLTEVQRSSLASRSDGWKALCDDLTSKYQTLEHEYDHGRSKIAYAVYEKDAKAPLLAAFESFFNPKIARMTSKVQLGAKNIEIFRTRSHSLERNCQPKNDESVRLNISGTYCQISSPSSNSVKYAENFIRKKLRSLHTQSVPVARASQCEWLHSADGQKRVEEIGKLTKTFPEVLTSHSYRRTAVPILSTQQIELEIGDIAVKAVGLLFLS